MQKTTVKNSKSLQALALKKNQLTQVKGGTSNFIIEDDLGGFKPAAPGTPGFIVDDELTGF